MKVNQALIMAGGNGTRLGLGTKSLIIHKNKIVLEHVVESCVQAEIERITVALFPREFEKNIAKEKLEKLRTLIKKYPQVNFIHGRNLGFRKSIDIYRRYLNEKLPFYLLCGQSPQSSRFLKQLATLYKPKSVVASGYTYRHDYVVSMGKCDKQRVTEFSNTECTSPRDFRVSGKEYITHFPYILDYAFYDKFIKGDNFKNRVEFYPNNLLKKGGNIYLLKNPITISELDYEKDLPKLFQSIDLLVKRKYWV